MSDETPTKVPQARVVLDSVLAELEDPDHPEEPPVDAVRRLRAEVERLTRERAAASEALGQCEDEGIEDAAHRVAAEVVSRVDAWVDAQRDKDAAIERAEAAEAKLHEVQREVCRRRVRDQGPKFGHDAEFERKARTLAKRLGWTCFGDAPEDCPECPGQDGRHAMSCSRGKGKGQLSVTVSSKHARES